MKANILRIVCLVALVLGASAVVSADEQWACTSGALAGAWGYTENGTVMAPGPVAVLAAAVGRYDFDAEGKFTGTQNSSAGGTVVQDLKRGTYVVNPDCTGTLTLSIYDPTGTTLRRTSVWAFVLVDHAREMRAIMTSMALPNGTPLSPIMTLTARRVFPGRSE